MYREINATLASARLPRLLQCRSLNLSLCHLAALVAPLQYQRQLSHVRKRRQPSTTTTKSTNGGTLVCGECVWCGVCCVVGPTPSTPSHSHCDPHPLQTHVLVLLNLNNFCLQCFQWKNIFCSAKWRRGKSFILFGFFSLTVGCGP